MSDICNNGKQSEMVRYKCMMTHTFDGHGVGIRDKEDNCWHEIGCIDTETDTCVGRSGGYCIEPDDIVVHTPQLCQQGLERYQT